MCRQVVKKAAMRASPFAAMCGKACTTKVTYLFIYLLTQKIKGERVNKVVGKIKVDKEMLEPLGSLLALPYVERRGKRLLDDKNISYPATVIDFLPSMRLLDRKGKDVMREFSGEWGRRLIRQVKNNRIVFPDNLFSRAIIISLIIETKPVLSAQAVADEAPLCAGDQSRLDNQNRAQKQSTE